MKIVTRAELAQKKPVRRYKEGVKLTDHLRFTDQRDGTVAEFIGSGDFASNFVTRQRYEVDAGRLEVPLLYPSIYGDIVRDPNLPQFVDVNVLGPGGVIFDMTPEGGEVKFVTVGEDTKTIQIRKYTAGIEYTKEMFQFNQTWRFAPVERWFGQAYNALLDHIHLYPIISAAYTSANQTAANGTTGVPMEERYLLTLEDAITHALEDTTNVRRGPYDLMIATGDLFMLRRALQRRLQDGIDVQSDALSFIRNIVVYDGWSGSRGKISRTYTGVTKGTGYLISQQFGDMDFQSYIKQDLQSQSGDGDLSRFIVEQVVYDSWFGMYAAPLKAVEEITWPTS